MSSIKKYKIRGQCLSKLSEKLSTFVKILLGEINFKALPYVTGLIFFRQTQVFWINVNIYDNERLPDSSVTPLSSPTPINAQHFVHAIELDCGVLLASRTPE